MLGELCRKQWQSLLQQLGQPHAWAATAWQKSWVKSKQSCDWLWSARWREGTDPLPSLLLLCATESRWANGGRQHAVV